MSASAIRAYDDRSTGQSVWIYCIPIPTHPCVSVHGCKERKTYSHTRSAAPCRRPAHTGTLVCMGEAPTHTPVHGIAEKSYLHVLQCMDLYISNRSVASEVHTRTTRTQTHARSSSCPHTCARMQRWSVSMGDPNMRREILTSLHRHTTLFARMSTDLRSLHACSAPPCTHTSTHTRACARWRRRDG